MTGAAPGVSGSIPPAAPAPATTPIQYQWKPRSHLLSFEEIERVVGLGARLGIQKVRLTGGEPLLRRDVPDLVASLSKIEGIRDLALTTNGFLFARYAHALRDAGLKRISFSLDSLDPDNFKRMTGRDSLREVLGAIELAVELGFRPVKVNAVVIRGLNDHEIPALVSYARQHGFSMRFIEFMPLDSDRAWQRERVVSGREILAQLKDHFDLEAVDPSANPSETARRWRFRDQPESEGGSEVGIIAPVTEPFCGHCNRIRLTSDGQIRTCLFSLEEHDMKSLLRRNASDMELTEWLQEIVRGKEAGHRIGKSDFVQPARTMSCIGG